MSEGRGEKKGQGTISITTLFNAGSGAATASTTTYSMENSRASVTKLAQPIGNAITVADTEYTAGAEESIRVAAEESCNSGDGLDGSPTGGAVGPSAKTRPMVGSGRGDGLVNPVGLPAYKLNGKIPVSPETSERKKGKKDKGKKGKKEEYVSPGRARYLEARRTPPGSCKLDSSSTDNVVQNTAELLVVVGCCSFRCSRVSCSQSSLSKFCFSLVLGIVEWRILLVLI